MKKIQCTDCGCPHTAIRNHVEWSQIKFFLAERVCENCGNTWMSLEPISNLTPYNKNTTSEERQLDEEVFEKPEDMQHSISVNGKPATDLLVVLVDEIKDLKIIINNTNKKVKELTALLEGKNDKGKKESNRH